MKTWNVNVIFFIVLSVYLKVSACYVYRSERFTFKVSLDGKQKLFQGLKKYNFTELFQITPSTFIFEYNGSFKASEVLNEVKEVYRDEIIACEPIKVYRDTLKPDADQSSLNSDNYPFLSVSKHEYQPNLVCSNYYGFNVSDVWSMGITGKGVTIGVTDVGINTNLLDLEKNIDISLSKNFLTDSDNVKPEEFLNLNDKAPYFTDHGNRVASIVAATMSNNICSAGIAYNATFAALKIFNVTLDKNDLFGLEPEHWTASDVIAKALVYCPDVIDVIVNAWTTTRMFDSLDLTTREALQFGANSGRRGLGTIYLVPAGLPGNGLSNSINTITVNSMGQFGTIPDNVNIDSSAITSGLGKGNNLSAASMVTTSHHDICVTSFKGVSAATAQIGGIIALGLEANPSLTKRDVEHLLVHSSDHTGLEETRHFSRNDAGLHFHRIFGFGLLNALKFVKLAKQQKQLPKQLSKTILSTKSRGSKGTEGLQTKNRDWRMESQSNGLSSFRKGKLVSVHFWDETPFGIWKFKIKNHRDTSETQVNDIFLTLYGKRMDTLKNFTHGAACGYVSYMPARNVNTTLTKVKGTTISLSKTEKDVNFVDVIRSIPIVIGVAASLIILFLIFTWRNTTFKHLLAWNQPKGLRFSTLGSSNEYIL